MLMYVILTVGSLAAGIYFVSFVRGLVDDYGYVYQDVDRFIDSYRN